MDKTAFAQNILFSESIQDKLIPPDFFNDNKTTSIEIPKYPNRARRIQFNHKKAVKFPSIHLLDNPEQMGILFHFFANHELLALELMALMILKFPDLDEGYLKGLIHVMKEEQSHLSLYINRMNNLGVEFGDVSLNDFFWKTISPVKSITEFIASMSLTFEQANIDFAKYYLNALHAQGDTESAKILNTVYQDEIKHVQHGLKYFNKWKSKSKSDWIAYQESLHFPLTPRRAKGIYYDEHARRKIGFSEEYIRELKLFSHSKGKTPDVYYFNPFAEFDISDHKVSNKMRYIETDLESLLILLAKPDDLILIRNPISSSFLARLYDAHIQLPQRMRIDKLAELKNRKLNRFRPWSRLQDKRLKFHDLNFTNDKIEYHDKNLFTKTNSKEILDFIFSDEKLPNWILKPNHTGIVVTQFSDVLNFIQTSSFNDFVLKPNLGSAGNQFLLFNKENLELDRLKKFFKTHSSGICEPWLNRVADFSMQFEKIDQNVNFKGIVRNIIDKRGRFRGTFISSQKQLFTQDLITFIMFKENGQSRLEFLKEKISAGIKLKYNSVSNLVFGIDMCIYKDDYGLKIHPLIEINPRFTMGRISLELQNHIHQNSVAIWRILSEKDIKTMGYQDFVEFDNKMVKTHPLTFEGDLEIKSGYLPTNDPGTAKAFLSCVFIAPTYAQLKSGVHPFISQLEI